MKKTIFILLLIFTLLLSGCEIDIKEDDILGAYSGGEEQEKQKETLPSDITLLYYPDMDTNPITTSCLANNQLLRLVYRPLVRPNANFEPESIIAESFSQSKKVLTVKIRGDMKFSDGSEVTADDVIKSLKVAQKNAQSPYYDGASRISKAVAKDTKTVVFTFKESSSDLAMLIDFPIMKNGKDFIGCGPYMFSQQNGKEVLTVNAHYPDAPEIPVLYLTQTKTDEYVTTLFSAGELDILSIPGNDDLSLTSLRNYTTVTFPSNNLVFIGINTGKELFADPAVRIAISSCIDRNKISTQSLVGLAEPTVYPFNPAWYKLSEFSSNPKPLTESDTLLLKDKKIEILVSEGSDVKMAIARTVLENFTSVGVNAKLNAVSDEKYKQLVTSGKFDLYIGETAVPRTMDATYLYKTGGKLNYGGFSDLQMDALYDQYKQSGDNLETYLKAFYEKMPIIPIVFRKNVMYAAEELSGYEGQTAWDSYGLFENVRQKSEN